MVSKNIIKSLSLMCLVQNVLCKRKDSIAVITFKSNQNSTVNSQESVGQEDLLLATKDITICLRFMTQFGRNYYLLNTKQWRVWLQNENEFSIFVIVNPLKATSVDETYSRMLFMCKGYIPGQWVPVCLKIKLAKNTQEITVVQKGEICAQETYNEGSLEWFYIKRTVVLKDM